MIKKFWINVDIHGNKIFTLGVCPSNPQDICDNISLLSFIKDIANGHLRKLVQVLLASILSHVEFKGTAIKYF